MKRLANGVAIAALASACAPEWVVWHGHTPDRQRVVSVVERGRSQHLLVDGREVDAHAAIGVDALAMAGSHVAYPAREGSAWRVYVDGAAEPGVWDGVGAIALTEEGARAYAVLRGREWFVAAGGRVNGPYDSIGAIGFDARGRITWVARRDAAVSVISDGVAGTAWRGVRDVHFTPVIRYVADDAGRERYVRDGIASPPFDAIVEATDDGFVAKTKGGRVVFAGGRRVAEGEVHLLATAAGHFAFARLEKDGERVVQDGVEQEEDGSPFESIDSVSISADGHHVGWVGRHGATVAVVVDAREQGRFDWARAPVFAEREGAFAFVAGIGAGALVRGSRGGGAFDVIIDDSLVISADGAHWAAVAGYASNRRLYLIADGRPCAAFDLDEWLAERVRLHREDDGARLRQLVRVELGRYELRNICTSRAQRSAGASAIDMNEERRDMGR